MELSERYTVDAASVRRTSSGYLVAQARVARTGIQIYGGKEVGRPDMERVRVYRSEREVFGQDALRSFAHRPVTIDHPAEPVTADNWRTHAVGQTGDEILRDGKFIRVPLVLMDAAAIKRVEDGHRELSVGYTCDLKWEPGVTADGEQYDAVQTGIRANHLAIVKEARGGGDLRIGDNWDDAKHGDFVKIGPDQYKRKGGKGKVYTYAQVKAYYSSGGWDSAFHDARCPMCSAEIDEDDEDECPHCGYITDENPYHWPAGTEGGRGGQFAPKFASAAAAKSHLAKQKRRVARAKVVEQYHETAEPAGGIRGLFGGKRRKRERYYEVQFPHNDYDDSADHVAAADALDTGDDNEGVPAMPKMMTIDGISTELSDTAAQIVSKAIADRDAKIKDMMSEEEEEEAKRKKREEEYASADSAHKKALEAKDGEIAVLKKKVEDSAVTPQMLDKMVSERFAVVTKAKAIIGDKLVVDGKSVADIRRQVVDAKLGDASKGWSDDRVEGAFATIAAEVKAGDGVREIADAFGGAQPPVGDAKVNAAYDEMIKRTSNAWQPKAN